MANEMPYRVGLGFDSHRLDTGRPLILGGLKIEYPRGLVGHSDADVVLHAITDALLGAAGLGDIGDIYPDTDPMWQGATSRVFVTETVAKVLRLGWGIGNLDVTIFAQAPRLGPMKNSIRENLASMLGIGNDCVNVKAKTGERVGHIGRGEAIACQAIVLIFRKNTLQSAETTYAGD